VFSWQVDFPFCGSFYTKVLILKVRAVGNNKHNFNLCNWHFFILRFRLAKTNDALLIRANFAGLKGHHIGLNQTASAFPAVCCGELQSYGLMCVV
jgi:hypothetical protein